MTDRITMQTPIGTMVKHPSGPETFKLIELHDTGTGHVYGKIQHHRGEYGHVRTRTVHSDDLRLAPDVPRKLLYSILYYDDGSTERVTEQPGNNKGDKS